ncbi:Craniofacial development protein 2 [Acanthosepion pharaonis]|uniref:Craniofacial development protein 2 n=1 Tax=Acanthosepion pharaonis TaxID=158019 RepID=A0A812DY93_ACAPH|nr:Craniofacial development protein 2 [Sepia pharaonis]
MCIRRAGLLVGGTGEKSASHHSPYRDVMKIAGWNVRTLRDEGTQSLTVRTLYNGVEDNSGLYGVAIALGPVARAALLAWEPVSHRLAMVRLKGAVINITVISVYAPTLNTAEEDKDIFYRDLQAVVDRTPSIDLLVVAGDWNARTGPADESNRHVLSRFALGTRCDNGDRLVNFAVANRLVVTKTRFQHPRRHLVTWRSNDGRTSNQIDYILVRARWASSVLDSRAYRGADTSSAHVTAGKEIHEDPEANQRRQSEAARGLELRNRFSLLSSNQAQSLNQKLNDRLSNLPPSKRHTPILSLRLAEKAMVARLTGAANFRDLRRRETHSIRADRNAHWRAFAEETARAAACGDSRKLHQMVRRASRGTTVVSETLRSRDGAIIAGLGEQLNRWKEHFNELLNHPTPAIEVAVEPTDEYDCNTAPPTIDEVRDILRHLCNNKDPGEDSIPAEVYKAVFASPTLPIGTRPSYCLFSKRVIGDSARTTEESASSTWWPKYLQCFSCEDFKASVICGLARLRVVSAQAGAVLIRSSACGAPSSNAGHTSNQQFSASSTLWLLLTPLIEAHSGVLWKPMACQLNSFVSSKATTGRPEPVFLLMVWSRRHLR